MEAARRTAALLGDAGQASNRILSIQAKIRATVDSAVLRADLDADLFRLFGLLDLAGQDLRAALGGEEAREKLRREAARLFQRDDVLPNVVQMGAHPDSEGCLAVDLDTQVALRRWAAAELGSAP